MSDSAARDINRAGGHDAHAVYVYCVGRAEDVGRSLEDGAPEAIEPDRPLEMIAAGRLAAVASRVPLSDYGEEAIDARLSEARWTAVRVMRHERVVEHFALRCAVVPLRFATIYLRRERVEMMLNERAAELEAVLARLDGREEWGVNVYRDRTKLAENLTRLSPRLREMSEQAAAAPPGQAYLLKKKMEALGADEARAVTRRVVEQIESELARFSEGSARLKVMKDEANEYGEVAGKLAFLIERRRFDEFRAAAERIAAEQATSGFRLELTGPWPAYNFAGGAAQG